MPITLSQKRTNSDFLFCMTNSPQLKDIQFTVMENKEKLEMFTFKKTESLSVLENVLK